MKDERGLYYYPYPDNKRVRMYVRRWGSEIEFRMWNADDEAMWQEHGWVPHTAIQQAMDIYKGGTFDPRMAYDVQAARAALDEGQDE